MSGKRPSRRSLLSALPSVDALLKSTEGGLWLSRYPRLLVLQAVRDILAARRAEILEGGGGELSTDGLKAEIGQALLKLSSFSLQPVINATGIVLHTNLGRAILSDRVLRNVTAVARGYSNLEYDIGEGKRGKRHSHLRRLLRQITGAEDAIVVNNNAAAVLLCLNTLARGGEVVVSRGELVEIGGSFRVPDVMEASGARLREVGTTNKTHLQDYQRAIGDDTSLLLKVHQSNYRMIGFTEDVDIRDLVALGNARGIPVMYDLGSGCLLDLKHYGIMNEPAVEELIGAGVDIVTFSGDKLLGGPQGGIIAGRKNYLELIQKNPLARALRIDKLTIAAFEATFMEYLDRDRALADIPLLRMLLAPEAEILRRARRIAARLRKSLPGERIAVVRDSSFAGGGSLPGVSFPTAAVSIRPSRVSVTELEEGLRKGDPPVIGRIRENSLLLDARTIRDEEVIAAVAAVISALSS